MLTDRERHMLWMMLDFPCCRYCLVCARDESCEKGDIHWRISRIIAAVISEQYTEYGGRYLMRGCEDTIEGMCAVHDYLARGLTDRLDEVIGLPLSVEGYFDSSLYGRRMFDWICEHFDEIIEYVKEHRRI